MSTRTATSSGCSDLDEPVRLTTPRLDLVPLRVEDAQEMAVVLADDALYHFIGGGAPTVGELRERYRRQVAGRSDDGTEIWHNWTVRRRTDDRAVGTVQATITADGRAAEIAWVIGIRWQGQGYASEAAAGVVDRLGRLGVRTVTAHVHPDHAASAAVAARAGLLPTDAVEDGERVWRSVLGRAKAREDPSKADHEPE
ncbi:MAG: GNAT family N-acetyltransferase [Candidatus Limnocylindrales bacterium]